MNEAEWAEKAVAFLVDDGLGQVLIMRRHTTDRGYGWVVDRLTRENNRLREDRLETAPGGDGLWWKRREAPFGFGADDEEWCNTKEEALALWERWKVQESSGSIDLTGEAGGGVSGS